MIKTINLLLLSITLSALPVTDSYASSIGQIKAKEKTLRAEGKRFKSLFCIRKGNSFDIKVLKVVKNRGNKEWLWMVGHSLTAKDRELQKAGYRRTSLHRTSGSAIAQCGIWVKR